MKVLSVGRAIAAGAVCFGAAALAARCIFAFLSPVLLISEDPRATMTIDGKLVRFERGVAELHPVDNSYLVEIASDQGVIRRRIYPWETDSGSITVTRRGSSFDLSSVAVH